MPVRMPFMNSFLPLNHPAGHASNTDQGDKRWKHDHYLLRQSNNSRFIHQKNVSFEIRATALICCLKKGEVVILELEQLLLPLWFASSQLCKCFYLVLGEPASLYPNIKKRFEGTCYSEWVTRLNHCIKACIYRRPQTPNLNRPHVYWGRQSPVPRASCELSELGNPD